MTSHEPAPADARPRYAPYAAGASPFTIGLSPAAPEDWIECDADLGRYLAEKDRLFAAGPDAVFAAEPESAPAQAETLGRLVAHLPERFPEVYRRDGATMRLPGLGRAVPLEAAGPSAAPPLLTAARLVQEDLLLLARDPSGWRLTAGALFFPSSWSLAEKFGRPLDLIHESVPGFGPGTRNASVIDRVFDNLASGRLVARVNWSIYGDAVLAHPRAKPHDGAAAYTATAKLETPHVRVERQTLLKLPKCGAVLFTVRIYVDSLATLAAHPNAAALAQALAERLAALSPAELAYKGLVSARPALLERLTEIAAAASVDP